MWRWNRHCKALSPWIPSCLQPSIKAQKVLCTRDVGMRVFSKEYKEFWKIEGNCLDFLLKGAPIETGIYWSHWCLERTAFKMSKS